MFPKPLPSPALQSDRMWSWVVSVPLGPSFQINQAEWEGWNIWPSSVSALLILPRQSSHSLKVIVHCYLCPPWFRRPKSAEAATSSPRPVDPLITPTQSPLTIRSHHVPERHSLQEFQIHPHPLLQPALCCGQPMASPEDIPQGNFFPWAPPWFPLSHVIKAAVTPDYEIEGGQKSGFPLMF